MCLEVLRTKTIVVNKREAFYTKMPWKIKNEFNKVEFTTSMLLRLSTGQINACFIVS